MTYEEIINTLIIKRIEKGWSQRELARQAGVSPMGINQIENLSRKATVDFLIPICRALDFELVLQEKQK